MKYFSSVFLAISALILTATAALADCPIKSGSIRVLANDFPALHAVAQGAAACADRNVEIIINHTKEHRDLQVAALTAAPAEYTTAVVANSSIVPLMNAGLIRRLDDLIAAYAPDLPSINRVTINGETMAIAFMANAQHLYVRTDILAQIGHEIPTTYEEVLAAAAAIRSAGLMQYPVALNTATGWNLGEEFINMYLGHGGAFFVPGAARPSINNATGIATLTMLKDLTSYANPDYLTFDSNATAALWEAGELALAIMWGSRGSPILDDTGSTPAIIAATKLVSAPTVGGGTTPASTLWWDGFTIATNISDEDAAATFQGMIAGISDDIVMANNKEAVWLSPAYKPSMAAAGVAATANQGAQPYPMLPYMGLMHTALGTELTEFLQGKESAQQALADVEAAYTEAAKEQGFIR